jgi:hypothetical protein
LPNENGKASAKKSEGELYTDLNSGNVPHSGLEEAGSTFPTPAHSLTKNAISMSRGMAPSSNSLTGAVKPFYFKFIDARDRGELEAGMTWAKYQGMTKNGGTK